MHNNNDDKIKLPENKRKELCDKLKHYIYKNLEIDIGMLQSDMLADFIENEIGNFYYNQGIEDSMKYITERADDLYLLMRD